MFAVVLNDFRLYQLVSPNLPVGAFTYSQGLEWAVESGWITDADSLREWLQSVLWHGIAQLELPVLIRAMAATRRDDLDAFSDWTGELTAARETRELRAEESQRGAAFVRLLKALPIELEESWLPAIASSQVAAMAYAGHQWSIAPEALSRGYLWAWLEGAVVAGVKLVPLGQTQGQQLMAQLSGELDRAVTHAFSVTDEQVGSSNLALAIASSLHETQYTRLYRS
ncbi:urease accessory protein UreF [Litorivicinus lipolyticus]|uniref:urease accessory protein UreF n=1 Tax=Litorivicinus lipolyticus TaxID=418701 RepID=UPI003B5ACD8C